jgi:hypothetical protein
MTHKTDGVVSEAQKRKSHKHLERCFECCGRTFSGNGGANHMKMHLLEAMPEYKNSRHDYATLRRERMRREDVASNKYGGFYAKKPPLQI